MKNTWFKDRMAKYSKDNSTLAKTVVLLFFMTYLAVGISIYSDYGVSVDESYEMQTAQITINYVQGTSDTLLTYPDRHYGALLSIPLEFLGLIFSDSQQIFHARHLINFLFFYICTIVFYFLLRKLKISISLSLVGVVMLVLHPHIFANSFYNIKDIPFLGLYIVGIFTLVLFAEKPTITAVVLHGLVSGILIVFRITGIFMVITTSVVFFVLIMNNREKWKFMVAAVFLFLVTAGLTMFAFLPALWHDPINEALTMFSMRLLVWPNAELFLGGTITAKSIPWFYLPFYFLVTTPLVYTSIFSIGTVALLLKIWRRYKIDQKIEINTLISMISFYLPLFIILVAQPVVYNGWRHIFFIYAGFVLVTVNGLAAITQTKMIREKWLAVFNTASLGALAIQFLVVILFVFSSHPYQFTFYNKLAGPSIGIARQNFVMDYWGLSYRKALENLLEANPSQEIKVTARFPYYLSENVKILNPEQRKRLFVVDDINDAEYLITTYSESLSLDIPEAQLFSTIYVKDAIINGTYLIQRR